MKTLRRLDPSDLVALAGLVIAAAGAWLTAGAGGLLLFVGLLLVALAALAARQAKARP